MNTQTQTNTTAEEFKIIEDNKDEPDLKTAQDLSVEWLSVLHSRTVMC